MDDMSEKAKWLPGVLATIEGFRALKANWDSYGGLPIACDAIEWARLYAGRLAEMSGLPEPSVVPTTGGEVGIEWHVDGWDCELTIRANGYVRYMIEAEDSGTGEIWEWLTNRWSMRS